MEYQFNAVFFSFNSLVLFCLIFSLNKIDEYHNMPKISRVGRFRKGFLTLYLNKLFISEPVVTISLILHSHTNSLHLEIN